MTTYAVGTSEFADMLDDIFLEPGDPILRPKVGDRCLRCDEAFKRGQYVVTFEAWDASAEGGLTGVHFHAKCAEEVAASLLQDVANLVGDDDIGGHTALRHRQLSAALTTLIVAGAPKELARKARERITE